MISCNILTKPALAVISKWVPDFEIEIGKLQPASVRCRNFPDGSLMIEGEDSIRQLAEFSFKQGLGGRGLWQPRCFTGLPELGGNECALWYTEDYADRLGEQGMRVLLPLPNFPPQPDYRLDDLLISVLFKRKISAEEARQFAKCLSETIAASAQKGIFDEKPIGLASPVLESRGRLAQFRIDISKCGSATLNWLILNVVNFGYAVKPVTDFVANYENNLMKVLEGTHDRLEDFFGSATKIPI